MPKLSTMAATPWKHILVYGPPKSGKTELVGKLAQKLKLVWLDFENGSDTLFKFPDEWKENITLVKIPDSKKFPIGAQTLTKLFTVGKGTICVEHGNFNCPLCTKDSKPLDAIDLTTMGTDTVLVIDSWSQIVDSFKGTIGKGKADDYKWERDDWGWLKNMVDSMGTMVQAGKFHLVVISHEEEVEMLDGKDKIVPLGGSRNSSRNFAKYFGEVIYAEVTNGKHKFTSSTTATNRILTGSRSDTAMEKSTEARLLEVFGL